MIILCHNKYLSNFLCYKIIRHHVFIGGILTKSDKIFLKTCCAFFFSKKLLNVLVSGTIHIYTYKGDNILVFHTTPNQTNDQYVSFFDDTYFFYLGWLYRDQTLHKIVFIVLTVFHEKYSSVVT